jgi:hypothetical protein
MKHHEKKYLVKDFDDIQARLNAVDAKKVKSDSSLHYYAKQRGNDVVKLVKYQGKNEIHVLTETNGTFALKNNLPVKDTADGLKWLKDNGFTKIGLVKMDNTDYTFGAGIVGLYAINDFLHSVILDFPVDQHLKMQKVFGLDDAKMIEVPYNKYLEKIGRLKLTKLR